MAHSTPSLERYRAKRASNQTPEPFGRGSVAPGLFVVQQHAARRLHFDLRLELNGVLLSWAVPKGPSLDPKVKRIAIRVEDHPIEYASFEGQIPEGNYGAGSVIVWDRGRWTPHSDPEAALASGHLSFQLSGYKLRGVWMLVKTKRSEKDWLLIKKADAFASSEKELSDESVLSGLTVDERGGGAPRIEALKRRVKTLGKPVKNQSEPVAPMLCQTRTRAFSDARWLFELKYDGYRLLARRDRSGVKLFLRKGGEATELFPEIVSALEHLPFDSYLIDGELVALDEGGRTDFQLLQQRAQLRRGRDINRATGRVPVSFFAFDLLELEGHDLRALPLEERKGVLRQVVPKVGPVAFAEHVEEHGELLFEDVKRQGLEGIVAKRRDSPYRSGRSSSWQKISHGHRGEFVVVGFTQSQDDADAVAALMLGAFRGERLELVGGVGTGFSREDLVDAWILLSGDVQRTKSAEGEAPKGRRVRWVKPTHVVEVRFKELSDDGRLRQPVFVRWRPDKSPSECVLETRALPSLRLEDEKHEVSITNRRKIFWPKEGITKGELVDYYRAIAPWMLPYLRDRPLLLSRYPDGIEGGSFFQKEAPSWVPSWVRRERIWSDERGAEIEQFVCEDVDTLVFLANLGAIPLHIWASRLSTLEKPDWLSLDLDPKSASFEDVIEVALVVRKVLEELGLECFVKTSGVSGLHVLVPLGRRLTHAQAKQLAELLANIVVKELPEKATVARLIADRGGKVYVDFGQNGQGKTLAAAYCVRPVEGAGVSMPLHWREVKKGLGPQDHHLRNAVERMQRMKEDPMLGVFADPGELDLVLEGIASRIARR